MTRKIVINMCFVGFDLTKKVERSSTWYINEDIARDDPILLQVIDILGIKACSGTHSSLGFTKIPDDVPSNGCIIQDYDGNEWVAEKHRTWHGVM
jgi:hypothetical protein